MIENRFLPFSSCIQHSDYHGFDIQCGQIISIFSNLSVWESAWQYLELSLFCLLFFVYLYSIPLIFHKIDSLGYHWCLQMCALASVCSVANSVTLGFQLPSYAIGINSSNDQGEHIMYHIATLQYEHFFWHLCRQCYHTNMECVSWHFVILVSSWLGMDAYEPFFNSSIPFSYFYILPQQNAISLLKLLRQFQWRHVCILVFCKHGRGIGEMPGKQEMNILAIPVWERVRKMKRDQE